MVAGERQVPTTLNIPLRTSPISPESDCSSTHAWKPLPPISQIPGLNYDYATSNYREPVRVRARIQCDGETEYMKFVRQGGRKDLLHYKEFDPNENTARRYRERKSPKENKKLNAENEKPRRYSSSSSDNSPAYDKHEHKSVQAVKKSSPQDNNKVNILEYVEYQRKSNNVTDLKCATLNNDNALPWERGNWEREEKAAVCRRPSVKSVEQRRPMAVQRLPSTKGKSIPSCRKTTLPKVQAGPRLLNSSKPIRVG